MSREYMRSDREDGGQGQPGPGPQPAAEPGARSGDAGAPCGTDGRLLGTLLLDELVASVLRECATADGFDAALATSPAAHLPALRNGDFCSCPDAALLAVVEQCVRTAGTDSATAAALLACLLALAHRGRFLDGLPAPALEGAFLELSSMSGLWGARFLAVMPLLEADVGQALASAPLAAANDVPLHRVGRHRILGLLGRGAHGTVYRARQDGTERDVALKLLRSDAVTPEALVRFQREATLLGRLDHEAIASVFDSGLAQVHGDTVAFIALELVDGESLLAHAARARLSDAQRIDLVRQVAEGVQHAHVHGIVHRDLSPGNVLVTCGGRPKVIDFGIAHVLDPAGGSSLRTRTGDVIGTPAYMSPEQAAGDAARIGAVTDVWSLGVLLFELLTGRLPLPVEGRPLAEVLRVLGAKEPARLRSRRPDLGADLDAVIGKALEREPADRYATAGAFAEDLARVLAGAPVTARAPTRFERVGRFVRRHRRLVATVAAVLVLQTAGLFVAVLGWKKAAETRNVLALVFEIPLAITDALERSLAPTEKNVEILQRIENALPALQNLPEPGHFLNLASIFHEHFGDARMRQQRPADAEYHFRRCLEHCRDLAALDADAVAPRRRLATATAKLGNARRDQGATAEVEQLFGEALRIDRELVALHPDSHDLRDDLAWSWLRLVGLAGQGGDTASACEFAAHALHEMRSAYAVHPTDEDRIFGMGSMHRELASVLQRHGAPQTEIDPLYRTAFEFVSVLAREHPDNPDYAALVQDTALTRAQRLLQQRLPEGARSSCEKALKLVRRWLAAGFDDPAMRGTVVGAYMLLARIHLAAGDFDDAASAAEDARREAELRRGAGTIHGYEVTLQLLDGDIAWLRGAGAEAAGLWREALASVSDADPDGRAEVLARLVRHGIADAAQQEELVGSMHRLRHSADPNLIQRCIDLHEALGESECPEVVALRAGREAAARPVVELVRAILAGGG